jgi:hypothetical protein
MSRTKKVERPQTLKRAAVPSVQVQGDIDKFRAEYVSVAELAMLLCVSRSKLYKALMSKATFPLPCFRYNSRLYFRRNDAVRYRDSQIQPVKTL